MSHARATTPTTTTATTTATHVKLHLALRAALLALVLGATQLGDVAPPAADSTVQAAPQVAQQIEIEPDGRERC